MTFFAFSRAFAVYFSLGSVVSTKTQSKREKRCNIEVSMIEKLDEKR